MDGAGNVYVADTGNGRIAVFSAAGEVVRTFGEGQRNPSGGYDLLPERDDARERIPRTAGLGFMEGSGFRVYG